MNDNLQIELLGKLAAEKEIQILLKARKRSSVLESIKPKHLEAYLEDGWEIDREFKDTVRMKKEKPLDMAFEDRVWALFAQLGFNFLNRDRQFHLPYDKKDSIHHLRRQERKSLADRSARPFILQPKIEYLDSGWFKITFVSGNNGQVVFEGGRGHQGIDHRQ